MRRVACFLAAVFLSGVGSIVNQVVWQRALNIHLAGCEAVSALIVVLVFMLGLGLGSGFAGLRLWGIRNPMLAFGCVELSLALVNSAAAAALSCDISESVYAFQISALAVGIPLRVLYALTAAGLLIVPCFLMGVTMPLASDVCQRQLGISDARFLGVLVFLNTIGAVAGAWASGYWLLPCFGQRAALAVAVGMNGTAGVLVLILARRGDVEAKAHEAPAPAAGRLTLRAGELIGFGLGFLALGYEMYLFRTLALAHFPWPTTFATVLCGFLASWSAGALLARRLPDRIPLMFFLAALSTAIVPTVHQWDRFVLRPVGREVTLPYFVPCFFAGVLFNQVVMGFAKRWVNDVGRYYAFNTLGCCLGILAFTLIGYEHDPDCSAAFIGVGYVGLLGCYCFSDMGNHVRRTGARLVAAACAVTLLVASIPFLNKMALSRADEYPFRAEYFGRDGIVEIGRSGQMIWNGLWHSRLTVKDNHIGSENWQLAAVPLLCGGVKRGQKACVIGMGTGVTAATLAKSDLIDEVDVYEINRDLDRMCRDYPDGTMRVIEDPKIRILWRDGRSGLALSDARYDLITQQPLYLSQAGSSVLLSREYMQLVSSRLREGGVFCIYSNAQGHDEQAQIVRQTVKAVFPFFESFNRGYMVIASRSPIRYDIETIESFARMDDPFGREIRTFGVTGQLQYLDSPRLAWDCPYQVTDNHPLVEYRELAVSMVRAARLREASQRKEPAK